jgi:hypothetical protein
MIQTGLLTTAVLIAGISGSALASTTTQGWNHAPPSVQATQSEQREAASGDVIQPPDANADPGMAVTPPDQHGKMPIIRPPAGPDTQKGIKPK